ncbi:unnamed protein product [Owenia fusiformis]|uniref:Uncharacterized protein n=1 Tax=Owenia fusiformis TaxID=6347 RepID=A0A8J1TWM3_OWEFU|nr:unnamed protein product [Owenia fusiformis]
MNTFVILAIFVAGAYSQLNQVADFEGNLFDCEFVVGQSCCSFRRYDADALDEDFAMCMGGSSWNQGICGCEVQESCDCQSEPFEPIVDDICKDQAALDANGACCQDNRAYFPVAAAPSNYTFGGEEMECHPVMTFDFGSEVCSCVGEALMETAAPDVPL